MCPIPRWRRREPAPLPEGVERINSETFQGNIEQCLRGLFGDDLNGEVVLPVTTSHMASRRGSLRTVAASKHTDSGGLGLWIGAHYKSTLYPRWHCKIEWSGVDMLGGHRLPKRRGILDQYEFEFTVDERPTGTKPTVHTYAHNQHEKVVHPKFAGYPRDVYETNASILQDGVTERGVTFRVKLRKKQPS